nr:asparagine synthase-related protein [Massilia agrisoli]
MSAVEALGGGVELTIDLDTLSLQTRKTWHPATLLANADLHFDQVKDALVDLYLEGVELAVGSTPVRITLSGGADSRCLLAASLHLGKETTAYSTGIAGSRALSYASDMAARCGVPHVVRPLDNSFVDQLPALMLQCSKATQGMSLSSEVEALWLRQKLEPGGILLHGAFGELYKIGQMHQYPFDAATASKKGEALTDQLWQRFGKTYQLRKSGFNETYQSRIGDFARQHLSDKVKQYARGLDTAGVLQMFYIDEFIGKVVKSSGQMWRQSTPIAFPFAYPPLIDLILRVRPQQKTTNRFVAHLLARTNSQLGRYPDSNTGVRIGASRLRRQLTHAYDYATALVRPHYRCFDHQNFSTWLASIAGGPESMFHEFNEATGALDLPQVGRLIQRCRAGDDAAARTLFFLWRWSLAKIVLSTITGPSTSTTPTAPQHLPA